MTKLRVVAGVLGILSLVIPWTFTYKIQQFYTILSFQWIPYSLTFTLSGTHLHFYSYFLTSFGFVDMILSVIGLIFILAGSIVLFASPCYSRIGGLILLLGFIIVMVDYGYDEFRYGLFTFIPLGLIIGFIGGVIGVAAKPMVKKKQPTRDPLEDLKKLKNLLDSGLISEDEFQTQKNKLLEEMKKRN